MGLHQPRARTSPTSYLEKVDGDTYLLDGAKPMTTRTEVIKVAGASPVTITVRETEDGPLISDVADIDTYTAVGATAPVPAPGWSRPATSATAGAGYAVALRWTALEPTRTFDAFDVLNTATDWNEFRDAAALLGAPAQNLIFADVRRQHRLPDARAHPDPRGLRRQVAHPGLGLDATSGRATIPFAALPSVLNPDDGWIVTANQAVIDRSTRSSSPTTGPTAHAASASSTWSRRRRPTGRP